MKFCPTCGTQLDDAAVVCTNCGANLGMPQQPAYAAAPVIPPYDHTAEFSAQERYSVLPYIFLVLSVL